MQSVAGAYLALLASRSMNFLFGNGGTDFARRKSSMRPLLSAGRSPLTESGMFGARNFISDNPNLNYSVKRDLELRAGPRPRSRTDFAALRAEAQAAGENVWATLPEWDPLGRTAESACPWCYPMAQ
jgi:hypothetical protein